MELKGFIAKIFEFTRRNGLDQLRVLEDLLDYIIGYLSPVPLVNKTWNYTAEQNEVLYGLMHDYFELCQEGMGECGWYDAWGDLFMELKGNSAGYRNQFFTPPCLADLGRKMSGEVEESFCKGFGFRPKIGDPTCGSARMLLAIHTEYVNSKKKLPYLIGEDIDFICCKMSAVNLAVHGCYGEIICHDSLHAPKSLNVGYIINEGLYPSRSGLPTIRTTTDKSLFVFDFSEPKVRVQKAMATAEVSKSKGEQLTLFD